MADRKGSGKKSKTSEGSNNSMGGQEHKKLEDQVWFHGALPREEINKRLPMDGQFLVRVSKKGCMFFSVISVRHKGVISHFPIKKTVDEEYFLDERHKFPTVYNLVRYYYMRKTPMDKSGVILGRAVKRDRWLMDDRDLKLIRKLGEGSFGEVWLGYLDSKDGEVQKVAVKRCKETQMNEEERTESLEEAKLMRNFQHKNVVRVLGLAVDRPPIKIVMEFCPNGSLDRHLVKKKGKMDQCQQVQYCLEAARGMLYLSSMNCIHRDLAARNCLLGKEGEIKISDFGMSKIKARKIYRKLGSKIPFRWSAPESLKYGKFSEKSDIWSFGVLMWEIFADGAEPWPEVAQIKDVYKKVKNGERMEPPRGTPIPIKTLMKNCWIQKPKDRITFQEAVVHIQEILANMSKEYTV